MTTEQVLSISTAHLPARLGRDALDKVNGLAAEPMEGGWWVYVPDDYEAFDRRDPIPLDVLRLLDYAKRLGCRWIYLHADNGRDPYLPTWDW